MIFSKNPFKRFAMILLINIIIICVAKENTFTPRLFIFISKNPFKLFTTILLITIKLGELLGSKASDIHSVKLHRIRTPYSYRENSPYSVEFHVVIVKENYTMPITYTYERIIFNLIPSAQPRPQVIIVFQIPSEEFWREVFLAARPIRQIRHNLA